MRTSDARIYVKGDESLELLLDALIGLYHATLEAQRSSLSDPNALKFYMPMIEGHRCRIMGLSDAVKEKVPGISKVIERGLPILCGALRDNL